MQCDMLSVSQLRRGQAALRRRRAAGCRTVLTFHNLKATMELSPTAWNPSRLLHLVMEQFHKLPVTYRPRLGKSTDLWPLRTDKQKLKTRPGKGGSRLSLIQVHISHKVLDRCTLPARPQPRQRARLGAARPGTPLAVTFAGSAAQLARDAQGTTAANAGAGRASAAQLALDVVADAWSGGEALCQRPPRSDAPRLVLHTVKVKVHATPVCEPTFRALTFIERRRCGETRHGAGRQEQGRRGEWRHQPGWMLCRR